MSNFWLVFLWVNWLIWFACGVVTALKAKWGVLVLGVILPLWYFTAVRLGKPHSIWAKKFYGREKMHRALLRFGGRPSEFELDEISA